MRRAALALCIVLPLLHCMSRSSDCGDGCGEHEASSASPFARAVRVTTEPVETVSSILEVEYGGCTKIIASQDDVVECIYAPGEPLRLWVVHPLVHDVRVVLDGVPWGATPYLQSEEPGSGFSGRIVGEDAKVLEVHAPDGQSWALRLRAKTRLSAHERALADRHDERATTLEAALYLGRVEQVPALLDYIDELLASGMLGDGVNLAQAASFHLENQAGRSDLAKQVLDRVRASAERYPEGRASMAIYGGHVLEDEGRLVEAATAYRRGARYAVRMDDAGLQLDALSDYAMVLAELGYFEAAAYWGARAVTLARGQGRLADRVAVMTMVARVGLRLRATGKVHDDPGPLLREVLALSSTTEDRGDVEPARLGLAALAVDDGELGVALEHLDGLDEAELSHEDQLEARDVRLRALLGRGADAEVLRAELRELEAFAATDGVSAQWLAAVRRGEVLERHGDLEGAREAYERSEDLLDRMIPSALLGVQGHSAPARRSEGTRQLIDLLMREEKPEEALCVARRARARLGQLARVFSRLDPSARQSLRPRVDRYRQLQREHETLLRRMSTLAVREREEARREAERLRQALEVEALEILSVRSDPHTRPRCDELRPREPGELLLGLYPRDRDLLVFVQDDQGTSWRLLHEKTGLLRFDDAEWMGGLLFDPFDERLAAARQVRVLASGEAAAIDVHALPWRGRLLVEQVPVVYGLDLPWAAGEPAPDHSDSALVLADARAKGTSDERTEVLEALRRVGWASTSAGSTERTAHELRHALSTVGHFHYAGHAYYDAGDEAVAVGPLLDDATELPTRLWPPYPGGAAAEPSYLPLGPTGRLDVQDVLMMEQVPRSVVLMGCATGVQDERMAYGGFSLATAFLGAGSQVVVASVREVDGTEASLIGRGLYVSFGARRLGAPGEWFMHAVQWAREHGLPERAVRDYRVLVP